MGITIVHKSGARRMRQGAKKALILAGGAVTGGSFKAGGIKALGDYLVNFKVTDFDIFVGISSGSLIAAPLSGGISPQAILRSLDGTSRHFTALRSWHYYHPNLDELIHRPLDYFFRAALWFPGKLWKIVRHSHRWSEALTSGFVRFLADPTLVHYDEMMKPLLDVMGDLDFPSLVSLLPSGVFDNRPIERYVRSNIERNHLTNDFREAMRTTGKRLYICAMTLDGAERIVFGPDEKNDVSISEAVMASTAMPGFYRPAHLHGVDYVDGGVQETANIDIAVQKGAELIVCYNPFRPYERERFVERFHPRGRKSHGDRLSESGILAVLNQIFRAAFHARLKVALEQFERDPNFHGDIILIEPRADDVDFFMLNPLSLANRVRAAQLGFASVRNSIEERFDEVQQIFSAYGVTISRTGVDKEYETMTGPDADEEAIRNVLEGRTQKAPRKKRLRKRKAGR